MSFDVVKKFLLILLSFIMSFSFVGCSKTKNDINIKSEKTNYNNIYDFNHIGFWIDGDSVYFRKSGFYNDLYYRINENRKSLITTDNIFNISVGKDVEGKISGEIQAFGNNVYFWYIRDDGNKELYQYNIKGKEFKKLLSVNKIINDWTIFDNIVIYSTFTNSDNDNTNSLWFSFLDSKEPIKIANSTSAFGVSNNKILYTQLDNTGKSVLYEFNYKKKESTMLCSFSGINIEYNPYNFTENFIVFAADKLHIVDIKTGEQKSFELPEYINFLSCYEHFAFTCSDNNVYRTNISTGETELLCENLEECNLLYSISDECAVAVCYNTSGIRTTVEVYQIYSDGKIKKILNI